MLTRVKKRLTPERQRLGGGDPEAVGKAYLRRAQPPHTKFELAPGDFLFMRRRIRHQFKVLSESMRVLLLLTPAGLDEYVWKLTEPAASQEIPPPQTEPPPPEVMEAMMKLNAEYGISR